MSRMNCTFLKFLLLFVFIAPLIHGGRKGSDIKFLFKKSAPHNTKSDDLKKLSDDEISLALSDLSVNDLRTLNNFLTKRAPTDYSYSSFRQDIWKDNLKRSVRESKKFKAKSLAKEKLRKSPEQKIRDEIQQLRGNVEKQIRSKLVRKKREDGEEDWKYKDNKYYINSPNIEEYIKMLEGSFPNSVNSQPENEGSHVRVKRL